MIINNKKILILAAHPDDETIGLGGTISKLSQSNNYIKLMTFTDGLSSRNIKNKNRNSKLDEVSKILGITDYIYADFPDNKMDTVPLLDICQFIENNIDFKPDVIFTHHQNCLNIDHSIIHRATITSFRPQFGDKQLLLSYYVPSSTDYNPYNMFLGNFYSDVTKYKKHKIKCLKNCYIKEMRNSPHSRSIENINNLMRVWGSEVGIEYAEKFQLIRYII